MKDVQLKQYAPLGVALGVGGLVMAAFIYIYQRQFDVAVQTSLAIAALGFALAMLLNPGVVQTWLGGRQARYGSNVLVMTLAVIGILIVANYLVYKNNKQFDLTEDQANTLAPETLEALKQLPEPVVAVGFYSQSFASSRQSAQSLLDRFKAAAPGLISYEFHDTYGEPDVVKAYGITRDGALILKMGDATEELNFVSESEVTGALIRFAHPSTRVIYFLTTHGEHDLAATDETGLSQVVDLLKKQNYQVQPLNLQVTTTVPADARAVIVAGPKVPVSADEAVVLMNYLRYNPNSALIVMLDPIVETQAEIGAPEPLIEKLQADWGLNLPQDFVIDVYNSAFLNGQPQPLIPVSNAYEDSPITQKLQGIATFFPVVRSVAVVGTPETLPDVTYTPLVTLEDRAWGETDVDSLQASAGPSLGEGDTPGPLHVAVAAENSKYKARIVVFGDSNFATNAYAEQGANGQLFLNALNWATTEESLINLTPKTPTTRTIILTEALTVNLIFLVTVIIMPLAVLVGGVVVWVIRRRHV